MSLRQFFEGFTIFERWMLTDHDSDDRGTHWLHISETWLRPPFDLLGKIYDFAQIWDVEVFFYTWRFEAKVKGEVWLLIFQNSEIGWIFGSFFRGHFQVWVNLSWEVDCYQSWWGSTLWWVSWSWEKQGCIEFEITPFWQQERFQGSFEGQGLSSWK